MNNEEQDNCTNGTCSKHEVTTMKISQIENKINTLEKEWDEKFNDYQNQFKEELKLVKSDAIASSNNLNELKLAIVNITNSLNNLTEKLNKFIEDYQNKEKEKRTGIIYPIVVSIATGIIGALIAYVIKK